MTVAADVVASARNNNLVAESDLDAAVQAIQRRMAHAQEQPPPQQQEHVVGLSSGISTTTTMSQLAMLEECSRSLQSNLKRVVQPITDEAFHWYTYQQARLGEEGYDEPPAGGGQQEEVSSSQTITSALLSTTTTGVVLPSGGGHAHYHPHDFTMDELLDPQAVRRVQELREQVRQQTAKVGQVRASVLDQAVRLAQLQVGMWLGTSERQYNSEEGNNERKNHDGNDHHNEEEKTCQDGTTLVVPEVDEGHLQNMIQSLTTMMDALRQSQDSVPDKVASLQDLITVVQEALNKKNGLVSLSQTERAIYSRDESVLPSSTYRWQDTAVEPRDRLTAYLGSA